MDLDKYSTVVLLKELLKRNELSSAPTITRRAGKHFEALIAIGADNTCHLTMSDDDYEALNAL